MREKAKAKALGEHVEEGGEIQEVQKEARKGKIEDSRRYKNHENSLVFGGCGVVLFNLWFGGGGVRFWIFPLLGLCL